MLIGNNTLSAWLPPMTASVSADMNRAGMIASLHRKSIGQDTHEEAVMAKIHLRTLTEAHRPKALRIDMRYSHLPQSHKSLFQSKDEPEGSEG